MPDKRVKWLPALFKISDGEDYANAPQAAFENAINRRDFIATRRKKHSCCHARDREEHNGKVPDTMEKIARLAGVGARQPMLCWATAFNKMKGSWWTRT